MDTLVKLGITDCFAVVGGGAMYLDNALLHCEKIQKYFNHHEQACAMAAESYARLSGRIPLVCCTSGPGSTNTLTGVAGAWVDSVPMLIISGQMRYDVTVKASGLPLRYRGSQEFNIVDTVKTMTKYSKQVINPLDIKMEVEKAYHIAMSGRRGPVWLDIPLNVQMAEVEIDELASYKPYDMSASIKESEAKSLVERINESKRPLIIVGQSIINTGLMEKFNTFAERLGVPVVSTFCAGEVMDRNNPLFFGVGGSAGTRTANFIIQNADFILTLGTSLGFDTTGYDQKAFAPNAYITMVDIDVFEEQKPGLHVDWFIHSDLKCFLDIMFNIDNSVNISDKWKNYCNYLKNSFDPYEGAKSIDMFEPVNEYYFWQEFDKFAEKDAVIVTGNSSCISGVLKAGKSKKQQRVFTNKHCGSMGYDLPATIGAAVAAKRTVYCVTGDGSIMMNLQELQTIRHYNLPVKLVVFSNNGYNAIRQTSKNYFNGEFIGCTPETGVSFPDFKKVADTFGLSFMECKTNADIDKSVQWLINSDDRVLLLIDEILDDPVVPRLMSRVDENGQFQTPALQDMYPFLPEKEVQSLMKISKENI